MNWDEGTWDSGSWDEGAPPLSDYYQRQPKPQNTMKRQTYYPSRIGDQVNWLANYAAKLPIHGPTLGVDAADVTAGVDDANWGHYVLSEWLSSVRNFSPSTTDAVDDALYGEGAAATVLPTFTAPALPTGVTAQLPGSLDRIFRQIAAMKLAGAYTEAIGTDLGIVGAEETEKPLPKFIVTLEQGPECECVKLVFYKYGHEGVYIEGRRNGSEWEFLKIDSRSPWLDERPLLVAGQPEVREYRGRFWDEGEPNGAWTNVMKVTVSP